MSQPPATPAAQQADVRAFKQAWEAKDIDLLAAAAAGALVGSWLGFNATEGLVALITTIVGAAVGANLTLLALAVAWEPLVPGRFVDSDAGETREAHVSTV